MYATAVFEFDQAKNGWLLSGNSFMRAVFLIFIFPRIIAWGRKWFVSRARSEALLAGRATSDSATSTGSITATTSETMSVAAVGTSADAATLPTEPEQFEAPTSAQIEEEPVVTAEPAGDDEKAAYAFDLFFLRWSLLVDGILTAGAALATQGWHMYLLTVLLPFGSGSAPAAKGVITSMCPSSQRTDALNAITLVENIARLATLGLFGFIFSALAEIGQAQLTFYCNGVRFFSFHLGRSGHCHKTLTDSSPSGCGRDCHVGPDALRLSADRQRPGRRRRRRDRGTITALGRRVPGRNGYFLRSKATGRSGMCPMQK